MSFYRHNLALGNIPQNPPSAPSAFTKELNFDASTDLTDNFSQHLGSGASQSVSGGVLSFTNSTWDQDNHIESKYTIKDVKTLRFDACFWAWASATNYHMPFIYPDIVNGSGTRVDNLEIRFCFSYEYSPDTYMYNLRGNIGWRLANQGNVPFTVLGACPARAQNNFSSYELISLENGTYQFKLNGSNLGSPINLGNAAYRLGKMRLDPISGWYNNQMGSYLTYYKMTYL